MSQHGIKFFEDTCSRSAMSQIGTMDRLKTESGTHAQSVYIFTIRSALGSLLHFHRSHHLRYLHRLLHITHIIRITTENSDIHISTANREIMAAPNETNKDQVSSSA